MAVPYIFYRALLTKEYIKNNKELRFWWLSLTNFIPFYESTSTGCSIDSWFKRKIIEQTLLSSRLIASPVLKLRCGCIDNLQVEGDQCNKMYTFPDEPLSRFHFTTELLENIINPKRIK